MPLTIEIQDNATSALNRLIKTSQDVVRLHQAMATGVHTLVQGHFAGLAKTNRNPYGLRQEFWPRMRASTRFEANATQATVAMPREVAQRYFGGTIRPTGGRKYLTIPVHPKAYRKRATSFSDLVFIEQNAGSKSVALLIKKNAGSPVGEVYYRLVRKVTQKGDRSVLPTDRQIEEEALGAVRKLLRGRVR